MIFYFSGTGNSRDVAEKLGKQLSEEVISISREGMKAQIQFELGKDEKVGIVFPVYWYGMPTLVEEYVKQIQFKGYDGQYVFAVATYASAAGKAVDAVAILLKEKGLHVKGKYGVTMVDNYVVAYDMPSHETVMAILNKAELQINQIVEQVKEKREIDTVKKGTFAFVSTPLHQFYKKASHTKKFFVTESCNGCKACQRECPCQGIEWREGTPKWSGECAFCLKCIQACPKQAIQYGKGTLRRRRYINPNSIEKGGNRR